MPSKSSLHLTNGTAYINVGSGLVTAGHAREVAGQIAQLLGDSEHDVFILDCRAPVWVLTASDLDVELLERADAALKRPAALIATPECLPLFRAHAWSVAQAGYLRKVFTEHEAAAHWAAMRRALAQQVREREPKRFRSQTVP